MPLYTQPAFNRGLLLINLDSPLVMRLVNKLHFCLQLSSRCIALSCLQPRGYPALNAPWTPTVLLSRSLFYTADVKSMSTSTADNTSRREKAAQAAERRLQATMRAMTPGATLPGPTACRSMHHDSAGTCSGGGDAGGSRKRPVEQVGFSDSDSDEVTCVGVSTATRSTQACRTKGSASAGRDGGAASHKRGRTDGVSD